MLWTGSIDKFSSINFKTWTAYTTNEKLSHKGVKSLVIDSGGKICFGTYEGVSQFNGEIWLVSTAEYEQENNDVISITIDGNGVLWFEINILGLFRYYPKTVLVESHDTLLSDIIITGNYPNPFNTETNIELAMPKEGMGQLVIYNVMGQKVRTLVSDNVTAGMHTVHWDGKNENEHDVSSGIYIAGLKIERSIAVHNMMHLR